MPEDAMATVLRLVADGRLSAAEAGPLLDALDDAPGSGPASPTATATATADARPSAGPGRAIRVEVTEGGRKVVNLRVPVSLGRAALARVPGLSGETTDRVRDALERGLTGPILDVDDGSGDGVRIVIE
jgi:hypothetical protein